MTQRNSAALYPRHVWFSFGSWRGPGRCRSCGAGSSRTSCWYLLVTGMDFKSLKARFEQQQQQQQGAQEAGSTPPPRPLRHRRKVPAPPTEPQEASKKVIDAPQQQPGATSPTVAASSISSDGGAAQSLGGSASITEDKLAATFVKDGGCRYHL